MLALGSPASADQDSAYPTLIEDGRAHNVKVYFSRFHPHPEHCNSSLLSARVKVTYFVRKNHLRVARIYVTNLRHDADSRLTIGTVSTGDGDHQPTNAGSPPMRYRESEEVTSFFGDRYRYREPLNGVDYLRIKLTDGVAAACTLDGVIWWQRP